MCILCWRSCSGWNLEVEGRRILGEIGKFVRVWVYGIVKTRGRNLDSIFRVTVGRLCLFFDRRDIIGYVFRIFILVVV